MANETATKVMAPDAFDKKGYQPTASIPLKPESLKPPSGGPAIEPPKPQAPAQPPQTPPAKK